MPSQAPPSYSDWTTSFATRSPSTDSSSTVEHCPECRAATDGSIAAARIRVAALVCFARQLRLEVAELASLLGVPLPEEGF